MKFERLTSDRTIQVWANRLIDDLNAKLRDVQPFPAGSIQFFAGTTAPLGWLVCDGGLYSRFEYSVLFEAIGQFWGGTGDYFNVPDFRNRILMGVGDLDLGDLSGAKEVTLAANQIPQAGYVLATDFSTFDNTRINGAGTARLVSVKMTSASDDDANVQISALPAAVSILPPVVGINTIIKT